MSGHACTPMMIPPRRGDPAPIRMTRHWLLITIIGLIAIPGSGMIISAHAADPRPQIARPEAMQSHVARQPASAVQRQMRQRAAPMHLTCVGVAGSGSWLPTAVRLTNDGPVPIPPGTTVYYWFFKDHRYWSSHAFVHGLARSRSVLAHLDTPVQAGASCGVSFHKLAWMQLHAPVTHQLDPAQAKPSSNSRLRGMVGRNTRRALYRFSCRETQESGLQNAMAGGVPSFFLDIANTSTMTVPTGTSISYTINGVASGSKRVTTAMLPGQHMRIHVYRGSHGGTNTCTAHADN